MRNGLLHPSLPTGVLWCGSGPSITCKAAIRPHVSRAFPCQKHSETQKCQCSLVFPSVSSAYHIKQMWIHAHSTASTLFIENAKVFSVGENSWHSPYIKNLICQLVPPSEGTVEILMFSPKRKGTSFSPRVVGGKQKGESLLRWCQHCDPKWPRLLVSSTCIHISTQVRKKVDTRSFHRKHSFHRKRKGFLCGGKQLAQPIHQKSYLSTCTPERRDSRDLDVLTKKEGYLILSPRCHWYPPPVSHWPCQTSDLGGS